MRKMIALMVALVFGASANAQTTATLTDMYCIQPGVIKIAGTLNTAVGNVSTTYSDVWYTGHGYGDWNVQGFGPGEIFGGASTSFSTSLYATPGAGVDFYCDFSVSGADVYAPASGFQTVPDPWTDANMWSDYAYGSIDLNSYTSASTVYGSAYRTFDGYNIYFSGVNYGGTSSPGVFVYYKNGSGDYITIGSASNTGTYGCTGGRFDLGASYFSGMAGITAANSAHASDTYLYFRMYWYDDSDNLVWSPYMKVGQGGYASVDY